MDNRFKDWDKVLGLDLAGSPKRRTGFAFFKEGKLKVGVLYKDEEILALAKTFELVMIDAPLSLPLGRKSIEEKSPCHIRECDRILRKCGHKFFPITLGPMRSLTKRGMELANILRSSNIEVFETFPGATYDILGIERKNKSAILNFYKHLPINLEDREYTQDELDAVACWLAGICYKLNKATIFSGKDGVIVVADNRCFYTTGHFLSLIQN